MSRSRLFLALVLFLVMIPEIGDAGLKIKVSTKGVEVGPVKIAPPPAAQVTQKLLEGKKPQEIANEVVREQRESFKSLATAPTVRVALENLAIAQLTRVFGKEVGDALEFITFPDHIIQYAPGVGVNVIDGLLKGKSPEVILGMPLATALQQAKDYYSPKAKPLPQEIQSLLATTFEPRIISKARFVVDDFGGTVPALINKLNEVIGNVHAVCVDNIIVFSTQPDASNAFFWGHEVQHVVQYDKLGIEGFAGKYTTSWKEMENEADEAGRRTAANSAVLVTWFNAVSQLHPTNTN